MNTFHHIGIFVSDLDHGKSHMSNLIDINYSSEEIVDENIGVKIVFVKDQQDTLYELVAPYGSKSPVKEALSKGRNLLNHVAYVSDKFDEEILRFRDQGCVPLGTPQKAKAFRGARVIFFLTSLGFIFELIEGPL
tara:strand:+ start:920 stop:1324 length:405 start_codon:yes stop_codon:yes gene_type:complete